MPVSLFQEADDARHEQSCQNAETETDPSVFQRSVAPVLDPSALIFIRRLIRRLFFRIALSRVFFILLESKHFFPRFQVCFIRFLLRFLFFQDDHTPPRN